MYGDSERGVAQMVARMVWDHEVAGSRPVTPTKQNAEVAQLVERHLAKVDVASPSLVYRSIITANAARAPKFGAIAKW